MGSLKDIFPPSPQSNVDFSISSTAQTAFTTFNWVGGGGGSGIREITLDANKIVKNKCLRAIVYKHRESHDRKENSDFLLLRQKDPFGELFSAKYFQSSSEFTFL